MFDCLGIAALGQCSYDPSNPPNLYFSIGEVAAALSITLIIPQFLKPIYLFRLRAQSVRLVHIYAAVFIGSICVLIATVVPNLGFAGRTPLGYPIVWELIAGCLFFAAFGAFARVTLSPATARRGGYETFVRTAADFLAHADDTARVDFSRDLLHNIGRLALAAEWAAQSQHESAFFDFRHRREIADGGYAASFFRLLAEPQFCKTLVSNARGTRRPW